MTFIRTAEDMREAAARLVDPAENACGGLWAQNLVRKAARIRALPIAPAPDREAMVGLLHKTVHPFAGCYKLCEIALESCGCLREARAVIAALEAAGALR